MVSGDKPRRLIVTADDFGHSSPVNAAVMQAHHEGILTGASLMVNGGAFEEAVAFAQAHPALGVGLHLTLCRGRSILPSSRIPSLSRQGAFGDSPAACGLKYFFSREARNELRDEIAAQFDKFSRTGLQLDHVNGHLHFHLHPAVLPVVLAELKERGRAALRLTNAPVAIDWPLGRGRWLYRLSHAAIFSCLSRRARAHLLRERMAHASRVFGLLENGRISEDYILKLLRVLPPGDSELYSHPSVAEPRHEHHALVSPRVKQAISEEGIQLIRYQDLWPDF